MLLLMPNQQCQSTEGTISLKLNHIGATQHLLTRLFQMFVWSSLNNVSFFFPIKTRVMSFSYKFPQNLGRCWKILNKCWTLSIPIYGTKVVICEHGKTQSAGCCEECIQGRWSLRMVSLHHCTTSHTTTTPAAVTWCRPGESCCSAGPRTQHAQNN